MSLMEDIALGIVDVVNKANPVVEGDYLNDDGLWVCGKCNTPKQTRIQMASGEMTPMCLCKCKAEAIKREEERLKLEKRERLLMARRDRAFQKAAHKHWTFENDDMSNKPLTTACRNYVENFREISEGGKGFKGLLFYGPPGTGKTYAAAMIANGLIDEGYRVFCSSLVQIANKMFQATDKQGYIDYLNNNYDLLVIDDLGVERSSEYMQEIVYSVINSRYEVNRPLIVTTNLSIETIKEPSSVAYKRIYDRVLEMCFPIEVAGVNKRRKKIRGNYDEMRKMLGIGGE